MTLIPQNRDKTNMRFYPDWVTDSPNEKDFIKMINKAALVTPKYLLNYHAHAPCMLPIRTIIG